MEQFKTKKEIEVNQNQIDYINYAYNEAVTFQKKAAQRGFQLNQEKELIDLAL